MVNSNIKFHEIHSTDQNVIGGGGTVWKMDIYRISQEECARLWESVPYVKVYQYNPKHLYPKLNGYGDNGQGSLKL